MGGTADPYTGMYMVPTLSTMTHDVLPYFLCCRYSRERCQLFYWRRPSSGCQEYQVPTPPALPFPTETR